jgi:hypothetical protein
LRDSENFRARQNSSFHARAFALKLAGKPTLVQLDWLVIHFVEFGSTNRNSTVHTNAPDDNSDAAGLRGPPYLWAFRPAVFVQRVILLSEARAFRCATAAAAIDHASRAGRQWPQQ